MTNIAFDTLQLARRLRDEAKFPQEQAESTAMVLSETIGGAIVTREYVDVKISELDARFAAIDDRFNEIDAKFTQIDVKFTQIDARFSEVDSRFVQMSMKLSETEARLKHDLTLRLGAMLVGTVGAVVALTRFM